MHILRERYKGIQLSDFSKFLILLLIIKNEFKYPWIQTIMFYHKFDLKLIFKIKITLNWYNFEDYSNTILIIYFKSNKIPLKLEKI